MEEIGRRKRDHLNLCLDKNVSSNSPAGWDDIHIPHRALPEVAFESVSLNYSFLDQNYSAPFLISSMSGGVNKANELNIVLAKAATKFNIPMGVGSQRIASEENNTSFSQLRAACPQTSFFANIGAVQLNYGFSLDDAKKIIHDIEAKALILHCNPLQEVIQSKGDTNFKGLLDKISKLKKSLPVPLIVKETGCGIDVLTAKRLVECGVDALDIAGMGGTHWGYVEGLRNDNSLGEMFRNWGETSASLLLKLREELPLNFPLIASGGIRHGLDGAKALFAGANLFAMAKPILVAANQGPASLEEFIHLHLTAVKIALFCNGCTILREWQVD